MLQAVQCEYNLMPSPSWRHGVILAAQLMHELLVTADLASCLKLHCCCHQYQQWYVCYLIEDVIVDAAHLDMVT